MSEIYLVLTILAIVLLCIFLVVKYAKSYASSQLKVDILQDQIEQGSRFNEVLSRPRKAGAHLIASLRRRSSRGVSDE